MRIPYFFFFALAALVPGMMLGAFLSAGPAVQSAPTPLLANLDQPVNQQLNIVGANTSALPAAPVLDQPSMEAIQTAKVSVPVGLPVLPEPAPTTDASDLPTIPTLSIPALGAIPSLELEAPEQAPEPADLPALVLPEPSVVQTPVASETAEPSSDGQILSLEGDLPDAAVTDAAVPAASAETLASVPVSDAPALAIQSPISDLAALQTAAPEPALPEFAYDAPDTWLGGADTSNYRPPQFLLISYDAASRNTFWDASKQQMAEVPADITYFISASSLVLKDRANEYKKPTGDVGTSWLGFAKDASELQKRLEHIKDAFDRGYDVGFQGVSWDRGDNWTEQQWAEEFDQAISFIKGAYKDNGLEEPDYWPDMADKILAGFRARQQSYSEELFNASSKSLDLVYDASGQALKAAWPEQENGAWRLELPILPLGDGKRVLANDFDLNFLHNEAESDRRFSVTHEEQMYQLLKDEFQKRYIGNRAPMLASLHFALWKSGAYWRAMKRFASEVCGEPEVVCTTHAKLAAYLSSLSETKRREIAFGEFEPYRLPQAEETAPAEDVQVAAAAETSIEPLAEQPLDLAAAETPAASEASQAPSRPASYLLDTPLSYGAPIPPNKPAVIALRPAPVRATPRPSATTSRPSSSSNSSSSSSSSSGGNAGLLIY